MQPKSNWIWAVVEMTIFHLSLVDDRRLEPQPTRHTTIIEIETRHDSFRNFDRPAQRDKIGFLTRITRPNTTPAIGHL